MPEWLRRLLSFAVGVYVLVVGLNTDPPHLGLVIVATVLMGLVSVDQLHDLIDRRSAQHQGDDQPDQ